MEFPTALINKQIWFDGSLRKSEEATIHIMSHGLNYATAAFEGIRVYNSKPFLLKEHIERLIHSCKVLKLDVSYSVAELCAATLEVVKTNNIESGYIRPLVWRGAETTLIAGANTSTHTAIAAWESFHNSRGQERERGYNLGYSSHFKLHPKNTFWSTKGSCVYALCYLIKREAMENNKDDMLALDLNGFVTEASTANLFIITAGKLITPIADCFLDGLTRQTTIKLAKSLGIEVIETKVSKEMVKGADAAFLTGTALELMPIATIDHQSYDINHPIYLQVAEAFTNLTMQG
jgi:branched-chain amino acid aminotransferase